MISVIWRDISAFQVDSLGDTVITLITEGLKPFQVELGAQGARKDLFDANDLSFGIDTVFVSDPDGNIVEFVDVARGIFKDVIACAVQRADWQAIPRSAP